MTPEFKKQIERTLEYATATDKLEPRVDKYLLMKLCRMVLTESDPVYNDMGAVADAQYFEKECEKLRVLNKRLAEALKNYTCEGSHSTRSCSGCYARMVLARYIKERKQWIRRKILAAWDLEHFGRTPIADNSCQYKAREDLIDQIDQSMKDGLKELEALSKERKRLEWLIETECYVSKCFDGTYSVFRQHHKSTETFSAGHKTPREAIDAAMKEEYGE